MEAGECGRTRGTCFIARRLEVVAVAGQQLWISWCVLGAAVFFRGFFFPLFFFECTRPAASMKPPLASFTSLLVVAGAGTDCDSKLVHSRAKHGEPTYCNTIIYCRHPATEQLRGCWG